MQFFRLYLEKEVRTEHSIQFYSSIDSINLNVIHIYMKYDLIVPFFLEWKFS